MNAFSDGWGNGPSGAGGGRTDHPPFDSPVEEQITQWRTYLRRRQAMHGSDVEELEGHLRDELERLTESGLHGDEAFLVAVKRLGNLHALSHEFAREHSERLWKQLVLAPDAGEVPIAKKSGEIGIVLGLALAAALAVKLPALFGIKMDHHEIFYLRNASLFAFPLLAIYFLWKRGTSVKNSALLLLPFAAAAILANLYHFTDSSNTQILSVLHLPIALWMAVGLTYLQSEWNSRRMDFVRFSGELFIYYVLIALGGGVFTAFTLMLFRSIGVNAEWLAANWLIPCGAAAAVLVGSWLVEAKQSVIENMAPVLERLFTPLFTLLLLGFLATMAFTHSLIHTEREVLIGYDLLLALVVGLVLYALSARDPQSQPGVFDWLQMVLVISALAVDIVALAAIASRISEFGFTPNRVAALGENIIFLINLTWSAWLYARFLRKKDSLIALEQWQVAYLPVYSGWAALVVIVFPPMFGYR